MKILCHFFAERRISLRNSKQIKNKQNSKKYNHMQLWDYFKTDEKK